MTQEIQELLHRIKGKQIFAETEDGKTADKTLIKKANKK
jgi:hypothetical protein